MLRHEGRLFSNILGLCGAWGVTQGHPTNSMTIPGDKDASAASDSRPAFGYTLTLLCLFMFDSCLIINIFTFNCLNMNTCTCLLKYLFSCGIKIY
jgi:hypothetical protein